MMRGKDVWAVAIRRPDSSIHTEHHRIDSVMGRHPILAKPGLRGVIALGQALAIGYKALMIAANESQEEDVRISGREMGISMTFAIVLFLALFVLFPAAVFGWANDHIIDSTFLANVLEGLFRVALFVGYVAAIGLMPDIRRVYQYHGAEHKTIAAYEHDEELTPDNVDRYSTLHVRCGTNFLLIIMVLTILVFSLFGDPSLPWRIASRVIAIPIIAAVAYEALRLGARFENSRVMHALMAPGLWLQKITTRAPDRDQIEIAITSFNTVLEAESEPDPGNGTDAPEAPGADGAREGS